MKEQQQNQQKKTTQKHPTSKSSFNLIINTT